MCANLDGRSYVLRDVPRFYVQSSFANYKQAIA